MSQRVCVTIAAPTLGELRRRRDEVRGADLVELRLDAASDPDAAGALDGRRLPVIITCRSAREGGGFRGSEGERKAILADALERGAEFVDVEASAGFDDLVARYASRVVLSLHDFNGTPPDLEDRLGTMQRTGAVVVKAAVTARSLADCIHLLDVGRRLPRATERVLIGMGESGLVTRALPARFGSCWTYAGDGVAPGQLPIERLVSDLHVSRVSEHTALYGIVGRPVAHSLSPRLHNAGFQSAGIDAVFLPLAAADADDFLRFADAFDVRGASVTIPFKTDLFARVDQSNALARRVGAINTLRRDGAGWTAINTDVAGFLRPLDGRLSLTRLRAAILGAGGAARAVAVALASAGADVAICARNEGRAKSTAASVGARVGLWPPAPGSWDLLVNATPVGMTPRESETPLPDYPFGGGTVYDLVYNPLETRLLRDAAAAGCRTIGGLEMLLAQAEEQFTFWTGRPPAADVFRHAVRPGLHPATATS